MSAIECIFEFSLSENSIMTSLTATIGDKVIQSKIQEKEEAKEEYDDAIAGGHAAIIAEKSEKRKDAISLKLGNLLPENEAKINKFTSSHLIKFIIIEEIRKIIIILFKKMDQKKK